MTDKIHLEHNQLMVQVCAKLYESLVDYKTPASDRSFVRGCIRELKLDIGQPKLFLSHVRVINADNMKPQCMLAETLMKWYSEVYNDAIEHERFNVADKAIQCQTRYHMLLEEWARIDWYVELYPGLKRYRKKCCCVIL